jgi:type III restriction enzyme
MQIYLEQLKHQQEALDEIINAMYGCRNCPDNGDIYSNPAIRVSRNIDVKMETGTGKTYVYTRMMLELFLRYGLNKFIIFVPSLAIKEGVKNFITADYAKRHFNSIPGYENISIDLSVINAGDFNTQKGRKTIPSALMDFLEGTRNYSNRIKCLLLNDAMLVSKSMTRDDYDQTLLNSCSCPIESIKMTRPIVIIDEPHRFSKDGKAWKAINALEPQLIVRFGATFPETVIGSGKNKIIKKDYENLVYNLNAVRAFNENLVKGIDIHFPNIDDEAARTKFKVKSVSDKKLILTKNNKDYELEIGDRLPQDFDGGITYDGRKTLSNDLELHNGMILMPSLFSVSYQELLLKQAIDAHFAKERENWVRENEGENPAKIKTLSLFFIDDIKSYRENDGWLKQKFEGMLRAKLAMLIKNEVLPEYKEFLEYSLQNIAGTHAGYFAEDNKKKGDDAIQARVDDILRNKSEMLSFRRKNGNWNVRRFLFSKWTLREGWDNPNVFVITKLRSSGSESSKIQEVGRGLRLPVDENGKRLSGEEFRLDFIIDWSEKEFAKTLCGEINSDGEIVKGAKITQKILETLVENKYAKTTEKARCKLVLDDIINAKNEIIDVESLLKLLPDGFNLRDGKVTNNSDKRPKIKLRKENWAKLKDLWEKVVKRYMVQYDTLPDAEEAIVNILQKSIDNKLTDYTASITTNRLVNDENGEMTLEESTHSADVSPGSMNYGKFLQKLAKQTDVGVNLWHRALCYKYPNGLKVTTFNSTSLSNIITEFKKQFMEVFAQKFDYSSLDFSANTTLLKDGDFVEELEQGLLGLNTSPDFVIEGNYLYDKKVYDSNIEQNILRIEPNNKVIVFGKIPRKSIKVPTYTGGTTTPDFIYAVQTDTDVKMNLFVEAKADNKRSSEEAVVISQKKLFEKLKEDNVEWREVTDSNQINDIIKGLISKNDT